MQRMHDDGYHDDNGDDADHDDDDDDDDTLVDSISHHDRYRPYLSYTFQL